MASLRPTQGHRSLVCDGKKSTGSSSPDQQTKQDPTASQRSLTRARRTREGACPVWDTPPPYSARGFSEGEQGSLCAPHLLHPSSSDGAEKEPGFALESDVPK